MRYVNLSIVLVFRLVSAKVHARFPDYQSLINAKLMLPSEMIRLKKCETQTPHESTWSPILWALKLLERARSEGKIKVGGYPHMASGDFGPFWAYLPTKIRYHQILIDPPTYLKI